MRVRFVSFWALAAALLAVPTSPTVADPANLTKSSTGNAYFNRPGADMATHDAELRECLLLAARMSQPGLYVGGASVLSAAIEGGIAGMLVGASDNVAVRANAENCMVVRGWRVVSIPEAEAASIAALDQPGQAAMLKDWVGAADPHGAIIRKWANDAAVGSTTKFVRGALFGKANLSFTARNKARDADEKPPTPENISIWRRLDGLGKDSKPQDLSAIPNDKTIIVFEIKGTGLRYGDTISFRRLGPDADTPARVADKQPDLMWGYDNWVWQSKGKWYAYVVPPGRWRMEVITDITGQFDLSLCLGSPYFEAKAGDVIYAGTFDMSQDYTGPDLNLEAAKDWLGRASPAATAIKPAVYVNGSRGRCRGAYMYNYEIKDAPYADGYVWGGNAPPQRPQTAGALTPTGGTIVNPAQTPPAVP
jgi:hypothetical protein